MRQVPLYGIIGSGRMAKHFAHYLSLLEIPFYHHPCTRNTAHEPLPKALLKSDILCVLISDGAIGPFLEHHGSESHKHCVHFSGNLVLKSCFSAHPLMTFGPSLYELTQYQSFPFIIEAEGPDFKDLLPGIPNKHYRITQHQKAFYHSLCVLSGNFSCILWKKYFSEMAKLNIPQEDAKPYLDIIFENIRNHPEAALTGPLARNDQTTIHANLQALKDDAFRNIYEAFVNLAIDNKDVSL